MSLSTDKTQFLKMRYMTILYLLSFLVFHTSYVNGEESNCEVTWLENCPNRIVYTIQEKIAKEGLSLTLSSSQLGKSETVAVLAFVGFYKCNPANGYTCETEDNITFIITTPCRPGIKFTISVDGGSSTQCTEKVELPQQTTNSSRKNDTSCQEGKPEGDSLDTNKNRNKRSVGVECLDDSPSEEKDVIGKAVGISIGVGLLVAAVIVAVIYFCRKREKEANLEAGTELQDENNKFLPGDQSQKNEAEGAEGSGP
ncbi:uncharacterized protein LOC112569075 [Pomacea canaliculata]|uniref:uncharacterized protein LOC112569075 n=1 Tax=Pomacea canaliculata TaxID=400727 RepID=UPI000D7343A8|nr:uncharacterized protein LOC112569075 [Pomacea canaliculata]